MHPQDTTPQKTCTKCGETKPATTEYFDRHKSMSHGLQRWCKACRAEYRAANRKGLAEKQRNWYAANQEYAIEKNRQYYIANQERMKERQRQYYDAHRAEDNEKSRNWYANNREYAAKKSREWYAANRKAVREYRRQYQDTNRERIAEYQRAYRKANHEYLVEQKHIRYLGDKEHYKERARAWKATNRQRVREYHRVYAHVYRSRKLQAEGFYTADDIRRQYKAQKGKCYYCHKKVGDKYHVDHVIPLSRPGGTNWPENLVIACPPCNQSKRDKLPHEWPQGGRLL